MIDTSGQALKFDQALESLSELLVGTSADLERMTERAEVAEAEVDALVLALADLLLAVDTRAWPMIEAAVKDANRVLLGARGERVAQ